MTAEAQLVYRSNTDIDQRNALVMAELPQVYYIAAKIRERLPQQIEMEDLVHAGVIGLIEACRNFDSTKNAGFSTFAKFRIRGAILDSLRKLDWGSRAIRQKGRAITASIASLASSLGRQPLQEEIAADLKIDLAELQSTLTELDGLQLVNQQFESDADSESKYDLVESAESKGNDNPFELCLEGEAKEHLKNAVLQLSEREQLIIARGEAVVVDGNYGLRVTEISQPISADVLT
jgi:RNA polymerase sigma factor for flagellar operon FliA